MIALAQGFDIAELKDIGGWAAFFVLVLFIGRALVRQAQEQTKAIRMQAEATTKLHIDLSAKANSQLEKQDKQLEETQKVGAAITKLGAELEAERKADNRNR